MKHKKLIAGSLLVPGLLALAFVIGKINIAIRFSKQVKRLFFHSEDISGKIFYYKDLIGLPDPVIRYFKHVLKDGQRYISYVSVTHDGKFKSGLDKDWMKITGEQYFTTAQPGFIWKGTTNIFIARDMFIAGKGRLVVSLFSLYNVVDGQGERFDEGELQRWLAESVWFPTNLLPNENLHWTAIDSLSAELSFTYNGISISYIVRFNDFDQITEMETQRYMGESNRERWIITMNDYKELNGIFVPTKCEAIWRLEKGDYSYARFNVIKIVYL